MPGSTTLIFKRKKTVSKIKFISGTKYYSLIIIGNIIF